MTTKVKTPPPPWGLPGKLKEQVFLGIGTQGYSFNIEYVGKDLYEFTIFFIDKDNNRIEYVLHVNTQALQALRYGIEYAVNESSSSK